MTPREGAGWAAALAVVWGVAPLAPALVTGGLPGHGYTDLYASVGGLGWFASHAADGLPTFAPELGAPEGMPFVFSSPLHGWLAAITVPWMGLAAAYTFGVALARVATVLCAWLAGRAVGLTPAAALAVSAVYGCAPFFHGYTVEGIVEGTDGWALALFVALAWRERWVGAVLAAALTVASSWYMAMCGVLLAVAALPWRPRATAAFFAGTLLASPLLLAFLGAFDGGTPLHADVRAAMGASLRLWPDPGAASGLHPFARTSWIGLVAPVLALASVRRHPWVAAGVVGAWLLSLGVGPLYDLPVWRAVRFPYRLHALVLLGIGVLAGRTLERLPSAAVALVPVVVLEGLLLSPVEPIVPTAPAEVPAAYRDLRGQVVASVPGPVAMPPGDTNPSRRRARYLLYWPAVAGTRIPWVADFNGVGVSTRSSPALDALATWDRLHDGPRVPPSVAALRAAGVDAVVLHRAELHGLADELRDHLAAQGARLEVDDADLVVVSLGDATLRHRGGPTGNGG